MAEIGSQKAETHRTRISVGRNLINFPGDVTTPTADIITAKLILNSVLSMENVKFTCADIANFYLNKPMNRYEHTKLPLDIIPEEIIQQYNLRNLAHKGFEYMVIQKVMYGIPQAGKIANDKLKLHLACLDTSQHPSPQVYGGTEFPPFNFH